MDRKEYMQKYIQTHREANRESVRKYRQTLKGKENHNKNNRLSYKRCKQTKRITARKWLRTSMGKLYKARHHAKHRELGSEILIHRPISNVMMETHHITKDYMIPIPKELHRSIKHNVRTGEGMNEINLKVWEWINGKRFY